MKKRMLICFDLDETLIHGTKAHINAYQKAFKTFGLKKVKNKRIIQQFGIVGKALVKMLYPFLNHDKIEKIVSAHDSFLLNDTHRYVRPIPGAGRALRALKKNGYQLALVSNCSHRILFKLMKAGKIERRLFSACIGNDQVLHPKPAPDEIIKAEHLLRLKADYMVGDTIYDIMAGNRAGVKVISVLTGHQNERILRKYKPHAILKSAAYLPKFLEKDL